MAFRTSFKLEDVFGSDLEMFPAQMRDISDVKRLTELNPMLQQAFTKPRSAEYLTVEELEDGSDQGGSRFFTHITTTVGAGFMLAGGAAFVTAFASKMYSIGRRSAIPWRMRRTIVINYTAKATYRRAVNALRMGIGFAVAVSLLEQWRGKNDVFNMIGAIGFAGFVVSMNMPMRRALRNGVLGMALVTALLLTDTYLFEWMTEEREAKLVGILDSVSPSKWLGMGRPASTAERSVQRRD